LAAQEEAAKTKAKSHSDILADATERIGRARKDTRADTDTDTFHISDFPPCDIFYLFTPLGQRGVRQAGFRIPRIPKGFETTSKGSFERLGAIEKFLAMQLQFRPPPAQYANV